MSQPRLAGSMAAFAVSRVLRVAGGEPLFGIPALVAYPEWLPFRTMAAAGRELTGAN